MTSTQGKKKNTKRTVLITVAVIIAVLIIIRISLPVFLLNYINKSINNIPGYKGEVTDLEIHLLKGAYEIKGIKLIKTEGKTPVPYFSAHTVAFAINWESLIKNKNIVGRITVVEPRINFIKGPTKEETQIEVDWRETVKDMMYIKIDRFTLKDGLFHYKDITSDPNIDLEIQNINMTAKDLTNRVSEEELLPSSVTINANAFDGEMKLDMKIAPLNEHPTFELESRVEDINLVKLNDFLMAYGNFDVQKGTFSLYAEIAAKDGEFTGYSKPFFENLEIFSTGKKEKSLLQSMWESILEGTKEILENPKKEQVATKIPISGKFDDPDLSLWKSISNLLRNAFIEALVPTLDHSIGVEDIKSDQKEGK